MQHIETLDTSNLTIGETYNYTQLCKLLNQPVYHSSQKTHQLHEFERFFTYERDETPSGKPGRKFTIIDIFESPLPYYTWVAHNTKYVGLIQDVLMEYLRIRESGQRGYEENGIGNTEDNRNDENNGNNNGNNYNQIQCDTLIPAKNEITDKTDKADKAIITNTTGAADHVVHISSRSLWEVLGIVNQKYNELRNKRGEIVQMGNNEGVGLNKKDIDEFYLRSGSRCNSIVISALDSLKRRGIIKYSKVYRICEKKIVYADLNGRVSREYFEYSDANDQEMEFIVEIEYNVMKELGIKNKSDIMWNGGLRDAFYGRLDEVFMEKKNWCRVFKTFKIWYSPTAVMDWSKGIIGPDGRVGDELDGMLNGLGVCVFNRKKLELNELVYETLCEQVRGKVKNGLRELGDMDKKGWGMFDYYVGVGVEDRQQWLNDRLVKLEEQKEIQE